MQKHNAFVSFLILLGLSSCAAGLPAEQSPLVGSTVQVVTQPDGTFTLLRNGETYWVKGAGAGSGPALKSGSLQLLAESGGNSVRTWGIEQLDEIVDGKPFLDRAHELGLSVTVGFWVGHVRHGFDYTDSTSIEKQRQRLRNAVLKYKDHPALLAWGLGNEMEAFDPKIDTTVIWRELNHLAGIIKDLDANHPVMTVISEAQEATVTGILEHYPNIDILGVNSYSNAALVGQTLLRVGWNGPYMLGEFGVTGTWEVPHTPWGAPVEPDPSTKAAESYSVYVTDRDDNQGRSLGSYVFFWGSKQEATATWFGMFLPTGEKLPRVDAMAYAWTGQWPENRTPKLQSLASPIAFESVEPGTNAFATVDCIDREGDELRIVWEILAESTDRRIGGDAEAAPPSFPDSVIAGQGTPRVKLVVPSEPGAYRLFVTAYDGHGGAVAHNLPFEVSAPN